ncbi:hypothetical protein CEQ90_09585 [Lewinellaceae bacterium SD302]|nr:hypothetical protein CEQ90_09585 [Lewinellaceae bacterium SD302]
MLRFLFICLCSLSCWGAISAQNVESFWSEINQRLTERDILRVSGNLNTSFAFNSISGIMRRQQAFAWQASAGINFDILGIQAPLTAAFANGNDVYRLPAYSFYGISPSYRWITLHGGDRSMNLSPYTSTGISYRGGGMELRPGKFLVSAFHGRLRRATIANAGSIQNIESRYRRIGSGGQVGYQGEKTQVTLSAFLGRDVANSLATNTADTLDKPEENLALSLEVNQKISEVLNFRALVARTALTRDTRTDELLDPTFGQKMYGFYRPTVSTGFHNAYEIGVDFTPKIAQFGLQYKRIDPGYRTLGSLYFQNDLEDFTGRMALPLAKGKYQLALNAGVQRNNLSDVNNTSFNRFIGSLSLAANFTDRLNTQLSFSNFSTTNRLRAINAAFVLTDSIVIVQTNRNLSLGGSYLLDDQSEHVVSANASWQNADAIRNEAVDSSQNTNFIMGLVSYSYRPKQSKSSLTVSMLLHRNAGGIGNITTIGPSISYGRPLFGEKVKLNSSVAYSRVSSPVFEASGVLRFQTGLSAKIGQAHQLSLMAAYVNNNSAINDFQDFNLQLSYGYAFQWKKKGEGSE